MDFILCKDKVCKDKVCEGNQAVDELEKLKTKMAIVITLSGLVNLMAMCIVFFE